MKLAEAVLQLAQPFQLTLLRHCEQRCKVFLEIPRFLDAQAQAVQFAWFASNMAQSPV